MIEYRKTFLFALLALAGLSLVSFESLQYVKNHLNDQYWMLDRRMRRKNRKAPLPPKKKIKVKETPVPSPKLDLVLFLGYPFAGTQATLSIMQKVTGYSMATNYGDAVETRHGVKTRHYESIPIDKSAPLGPFKYRMDLPLPPAGSDILVKSHAAGHCMDMGAKITPECDLQNTVVPLTDLARFFRDAAYAFKYTPKTRKTSAGFYNPHRAKKVIYLLRDPLEILEARWLNWVEGNPKVNSGPIQDFCNKLDKHQRANVLVNSWYPERAKKLARKTPCHTELYRIVRYYTQASRLEGYLASVDKEVMEERGFESSGKQFALELHFNDWDNDYFGTLGKVLSFLNVKSKESSMKSQYFRRMEAVEIPGSFSGADKEAAWKFIMAVIDGDNDVAKLFSRYMPKQGEVTRTRKRRKGRKLM